MAVTAVKRPLYRTWGVGYDGGIAVALWGQWHGGAVHAAMLIKGFESHLEGCLKYIIFVKSCTWSNAKLTIQSFVMSRGIDVKEYQKCFAYAAAGTLK